MPSVSGHSSASLSSARQRNSAKPRNNATQPNSAAQLRSVRRFSNGPRRNSGRHHSSGRRHASARLSRERPPAQRPAARQQLPNKGHAATPRPRHVGNQRQMASRQFTRPPAQFSRSASFGPSRSLGPRGGFGGGRWAGRRLQRRWPSLKVHTGKRLACPARWFVHIAVQKTRRTRRQVSVLGMQKKPVP